MNLLYINSKNSTVADKTCHNHHLSHSNCRPPSPLFLSAKSCSRIMVTRETRKSPQINKKPSKQSQNQPENSQKSENNKDTNSGMFSPRFKSVAAMAGWDEEALLLASLVVEDTPERNFRDKKRSDLQFKTPPTNSRRKRRAQRRSPASIPITVLNLDEEESPNNNEGGDERKHTESESAKSAVPERIERKNTDSECVKSDKPEKVERDERKVQNTSPSPSPSASCSNSSTLPCMDRLREELSCAICLEICFEPSTTACGHSFCKKCLRSAADKCGKRCPKCRQLISNGRSCIVNTVLWNTIQLLFPQEVEARKAAGALNSREASERESRDEQGGGINFHVSRRLRPGNSSSSNSSSGGSRRVEVRNSNSSSRSTRQDEDAALALRLQREEFMAIYRGSSLAATTNLRAMAQRAIRIRNRPV